MNNKKKIMSILIFLYVALSSYGQVTYYTSVNLNLRSGPGTNYKVLTVVPQNVTIDLDEVPPTWLLVSYNGTKGYICTKYLKRLSGTFNALYGISDNEYVGNKTHNNIYGGIGDKNAKYYYNKSGDKVQSPTYYKSVPSGATAICKDGTYSFSRSRKGTCSHHGGVLRWL